MTTPGGPIDTAYVLILPDFDQFTARLLGGIEKEMAKLRADVNRIMGGIESDTNRHFLNIGNTMSRESNKASRAVRNTLNDVGRDLSKVGLVVNRGFAEISDGIGVIGSAVSGTLGDAFKSIWGDVTNLAGSLSQLPIKLIAIGLATIPLIGTIAGLGAELGSLVGLVGLLPAGLAVTVAAFAPALIAFHGLGDAIAAAFGNDPTKFKEALKSLTPAAQEIVKDIAALKQPFTDLRRRVQEAFFSPLVDSVDQFSNNLLGPLTEGLVVVARQAGGIISDLVDVIASPKGGKALTEIFQTTATILEAFRPAITALATGFGKITVAALPFIQLLSEGFAKLLTEFGNFLTKSVDDKSFDNFIREAILAVEDLVGLVKSLGGFLGALFSGDSKAGGKAILDIFTQLFNEMTEFLKSETGQNFIHFLIVDTVVFIGMLKKLIEILAIIFVAFTDFFGFFSEAALQVAKAFGFVDDKTKEVKDSILSTFKDIPEALKSFAGTFADAGKHLIKAFIGGFDQAGDFISGVAGNIVGGVKKGLNFLIGKLNIGINALDEALLFVSLPRISTLAKGGLAFGPSILGEAGPELAVPLRDPRAQDAIRMALGGAMTGTTFAAGSIVNNISFDGAVPTQQQAYEVGQAVGQGIANFLSARDTRTAVRSL